MHACARLVLSVVVVGLAISGCGSPTALEPRPDAGATDAGTMDAGTIDAGSSDVGLGIGTESVELAATEFGTSDLRGVRPICGRCRPGVSLGPSSACRRCRGLRAALRRSG
jgi:hypothetical protein